MIKNKNSLVSVFEIVFVFLLFSGVYLYFGDVSTTSEKDYKFTIESSLDTLYFDSSNRAIIMDEDLSNSIVVENWTNVSNYLDTQFLNYELEISNNSVSKKIFNCSSSNEKYFSEKIISIKNNTVFEFRKIKLGVCY